ncbi:MAG: transcriptional repressor [Thermoleophilia bacterium]|nr:transcriptional repressor [Thermoleophilia bacterium]
MADMNSPFELPPDLKNRGFRLTKMRKAIMEEMSLAGKPLSVKQLTALLRDRGLSPHKTSVYRALNFMLETGLVTRTTFGEKQGRYELSALGHHHHAVCESCGEIKDVDCSRGIREIEEVLRSLDFRVNFHLVEFVGVCKRCQS